MQPDSWKMLCPPAEIPGYKKGNPKDSKEANLTIKKINKITTPNIPRKEASVMVILSLIIIASILTAFGVFDTCVSKLKSALIIPITGFAHSMTSAALEYRKEGLVLGIGANIFKLAGTVILYGIVSVYLFGIIRLIFIGG